MKKIVQIIILVGINNLLFAQQFVSSPSIIFKSDKSILPEVVEIINQRMAVAQYETVQLALDRLHDSLTMVELFNHKIFLARDRVEVRTESSFSWFGKSADGINVGILTIRDSDIQGLFTIANKTIRIETILGQTVATLIDQSKYPRERCEFNSSIDKDNYNFHDKRQKDDKHDETKYKTTYPSQSASSYQCKLRVLVLYTPGAKAQKSAMENHINLAIDELNQSYNNSSVGFQAELVFVGEVSYAESGDIATDVERFANSNDNHLDNVHTLRETYAADVCVLIVDDPSYCGIARGLKVCKENAFCVVNWDCATGYYSFAHEIGHLIGCQHHPEDPTDSDLDSDLPYGHGFKNDDDDWRTIMSYSCSNGCDRIIWWSNPGKTRGGDAMGTSSNHDNARVLTESIPNVMTFRPATGKRVVSQADINSAPVGVIYHPNKVETSGQLIIPNGSSWGFLSHTSVELNQGFQTNSGSIFEAKIIPQCGIANSEQCDYSVSSDLVNKQMRIPLTKNNSFAIYPNPNNGIDLNIHITNFDANGKYKIRIYDVLGRVFADYVMLKGDDIVELGMSTAGIYSVELYKDGKKLFTQKLILQ
jgi:hypothetical protein